MYGLPIVILVSFCSVNGEKQDICNNGEYHAVCPGNEAIVMEHAVYGRMRLGECVETDFGHLGCQNDVLHLADRWCSGRRECTISVPNDDLVAANKQCNKDLSSYLELEYNCLPVSQHTCSHQQQPTRLSAAEGYITSHVTRSPGCTYSKASWEIRAQPGQTIHIWLLDFSALQREKTGLHVRCTQPYGYILERTLGVNHTLCGGLEREFKAYNSKTNTVEIHTNSGGRNAENSFMIQYKLVGCSDLTPPAEAWYKREGSEAVIGCKSNDRVWRLSCHGNTWDGVVGNCSTKGPSSSSADKMDFSFSSVIFLTGVVCAAFLLVIVVVVAGSVYIKKQSIKHDIKLRSEYSAATLSPSQYYTVKPGYTLDSGSTMQQPVEAENQPLVQIWDRSLGARTQSHAGHHGNSNIAGSTQRNPTGSQNQNLMH